MNADVGEDGGEDQQDGGELAVHDASLVGVVVAGAGDPGDEDVVGVVDEVVAGERVDELALAAQVRGGDGDELAVAGGRRELARRGPAGRRRRGRRAPPRRGRRVVAGARRLDDRGDRGGVADDEPVEQLSGCGDGMGDHPRRR